MRPILLQAIRGLVRAKGIYNVGSDKHRKLEEQALAILVRSAWIERQAGFTERGLALLQVRNLCMTCHELMNNIGVCGNELKLS